MGRYNDAVLTLTAQGTPDPFVVVFRGKYYLIFTVGDRIELWKAGSLFDFRHRATRYVLFKPPPGTEHSAGLWAPELHEIDGRWFVYYAAADAVRGNASHRMYVLEGPPSSQEPIFGPWQFAGPVQGLPSHQWAIDGTIVRLQGGLYFVYSGWPLDEPGDSDLIQQLFIAKLSSPTCVSSSPVMISRPEHPWEFSIEPNGAHGINEGPQFLSSPNGRWHGIAFSCAGSWTRNYKMGILHHRGGDPLDPTSWEKDTEPLLQNAPSLVGPWAPGHGCFLQFGNETVAIFHATDRPTDGWGNRKARMQRVHWSQHGPLMGVVGRLVTDEAAFTKGSSPPDAPSSTQPGLHISIHCNQC